MNSQDQNNSQDPIQSPQATSCMKLKRISTTLPVNIALSCHLNGPPQAVCLWDSSKLYEVKKKEETNEKLSTPLNVKVNFSGKKTWRQN